MLRKRLGLLAEIGAAVIIASLAVSAILLLGRRGYIPESMNNLVGVIWAWPMLVLLATVILLSFLASGRSLRTIDELVALLPGKLPLIASRIAAVSDLL